MSQTASPTVMRRRVATIVPALLLHMFALGAEPPKQERIVIASLVPGPPSCPQSSPVRTAFEAAIRRNGVADASFTRLCYSELADVEGRLKQIIEGKPSVIVVWGSAVAARQALNATANVPIVFSDAADPVANGVVQSLAHPGGHATGISNADEDLAVKRVQLLKDVLPAMARLGILANLSNPDQPHYAKKTLEAAGALGIKARIYSAENGPLSNAFEEMQRDRVDAMVLLPDAWFYPQRADIVALAEKHRIPAMYTNTAYPDLGGFLTYAPDLVGMGEQAAGFVTRILKGSSPADIPVEQPTKFQFIVNLKTARLLGVNIPASAMLRATRVIE